MVVGENVWGRAKPPGHTPFPSTPLDVIGRGWTPVVYPHTREVTGSSPVPPTNKEPGAGEQEADLVRGWPQWWVVVADPTTLDGRRPSTITLN